MEEAKRKKIKPEEMMDNLIDPRRELKRQLTVMHVF